MRDYGWVKIHRQICENQIWLSEPFSKGQAWIDLILNANHKDKIFESRGSRGCRVLIKRGQLGWSEETMKTRWRWSRKKLRNFLSVLRNKGQIDTKNCDFKTTITTILNYENYQKNEEKEGTAKGPAKGTAKIEKKVQLKENEILSNFTTK